MTLKDKLIAQAEELGIKTDKMTIAKLKGAIAAAQPPAAAKSVVPKPPVAEKTEAAETVESTDENDEEEEEAFAKAGKRSRKSVKATEEEEARQARKEAGGEATDAPAPKKVVPPTRPKSERRSKKYKLAVKQADIKKIYSTQEALGLVLKTSTTKFDSSVDVVLALGVNVKLAEQNIRDSVILPAGSGKDLRIAVFAEEEEAKQAIAAGANIAGKEVFLQQLDKGQLDFDILIAMPQLMASLSKYAKVLGPKGLMPNPKSGTITKDVVKAVKEAKAGRVEYRVEENGLVHLSIGKVSFGAVKLQENFEAVLASIKSNKPANLKGVYIKSIYVSTTMGPSLQMAVAG